MRKLLFRLVLFVSAVMAARAEQIVISEINYNPAPGKPEFIELWNITLTPLDFAKWKFTDGVAFEFPDFNAGSPQDAFIAPFERIVVSASNPATTRAAYGISPAVRVFGP
jgi:hypothetical protein